MKVAILAGGLGTRLSEETVIRPKPMVEIGGKPILWHIMKNYSAYGYNDFVIMLGYKGYQIKEYFMNYFLHQSDITVDIKKNSMEVHNNQSEPWKVTLIDTGRETLTGGRVLRAKKFLADEPFLLTYGDGVGDVNIKELVKFHLKNEKTMTLTAVQPEGRFGALNIKNNQIHTFDEKPKGDGGWVNGGFFVCQPEIFSFINEGDKTIFEKSTLPLLAKAGELAAYKHQGFWMAMDTLRDKTQLEELWSQPNPPWKIWHD